MYADKLINIKAQKDKILSTKGWSDEELELFELQYNESIDTLIALFPNKNRAELLRAQKDRINKELVIHSEKWIDDELQIIKSHPDLTYNELARLLPQRSVWSILNVRKKLGLTKNRIAKQPWRPLTADEYAVLGELKTNKVHYTEICKILNIPYSQYQAIMYGITSNEDILEYRKKYPNAVRDTSTYRIWSKEENDLLQQLQKEGYLLEDMAAVFGLSVAKIRSKLTYLGVPHQEIKTKCKESRIQKREEKKETLKWLNSEITHAEESLGRLDTAIAQAKEELGNINTEYAEKSKLLEELNKNIQSHEIKSYHPAIKLIADHLSQLDPIYFDEKVMHGFQMQYGRYKEKTISDIKRREPRYLNFLFQNDIRVALAIAVAFMNDKSVKWLQKV